MKEKTLITITRQYGSGGKEVASIVAKKLGFRCYDRNIVAMAAEHVYDGEDINELLDRSYNNPENCLGNLGDFAYERVPTHNRMYIEQAKVLLKIAERESAVILGRCADYILRDQPHVYSFFIYADDEFRLERAKTHYGERTLKELDEEDKGRKRYYAYYTGQEWGNPRHYDLMINVSKLSLENAADMIIKYVKLRQENEE
ncbi:AAA family ATPase [uncultured Megasphaera sp.]|uniref:cytidylate kinase-like family protein n=1 Tax=uncultured Megasphaera sp. TaxID=165188 RepID=UPI0025E05E7F|nr:cytidylate kinase-like family protein [uncultured Megasphaera sp.]